MKAVFPIAGRAAIIIRSEGCQPPVSLSTALKPEGTPKVPVSLLAILLCPRLPLLRNLQYQSPFYCTIRNFEKAFSASSKSSNTSVDSL